jgi:hypothetical protein
MSGFDYWDPLSQSDRRKELERDRAVARDTMHSRAQSSLVDESGGRFSKVSPSKVTGAEPISYPQQPEGSPWAHADRNPEPPFGDVNEMEPVGSAAEIQRSLERPTPPDDSLVHAVSVDGDGQEESIQDGIAADSSPNSKRPNTALQSPEAVTAEGGGGASSQPTRFQRRF